MMRVKEFKESTTKTEYRVSGQTYYKNPRGKDDLDEKMNTFLKENEVIKVNDIKYQKMIKNVFMNHSTAKIEISTALLMYDEE
jgi:hypothetical protein